MTTPVCEVCGAPLGRVPHASDCPRPTQTISKHDIVEYDGWRYVAWCFSGGRWFFAKTVKDGTRPDHRRENQYIPPDWVKVVGKYTPKAK